MSVTDVGVAVTNLRFVCKTITCASAFTEMAIIFISGDNIIVKAVAGYAKDAILGACHRIIDEQEHKIICRAGPEQDTIFHLRVTACREQGNHCRDERLAGVASRWQGDFALQLIRLESLGSELQQSYYYNFHPVADKFTMCTDRK